MAEIKKKAKLSIEEKIARREEMAQKNSNELKLLKRKLSEKKQKERDRRIYAKGIGTIQKGNGKTDERRSKNGRNEKRGISRGKLPCFQGSTDCRQKLSKCRKGHFLIAFVYSLYHF